MLSENFKSFRPHLQKLGDKMWPKMAQNIQQIANLRTLGLKYIDCFGWCANISWSWYRIFTRLELEFLRWKSGVLLLHHWMMTNFQLAQISFYFLTKTLFPLNPLVQFQNNPSKFEVRDVRVERMVIAHQTRKRGTLVALWNSSTTNNHKDPHIIKKEKY